MIDVDLIKKRKELYGNNFPMIAREWTKTLSVSIKEPMVAKLMAQMKETRIRHINKILKEKSLTLNEIDKLTNALGDSEKDRANYLWIAENYRQYEEL